TYDRGMGDVFALQRDVARDIAQHIRVRLRAAEPAPQVQPEAYDLYLRGKYHANRENAKDNQEAITLLERAVRLDPQFAPAHGELARVYGMRSFYWAPNEPQWEERGFAEAEKALKL